MTKKDKEILRDLAKKQAEYALLPVMEERKKQWFNINTGKAEKPPVVIETCTFDVDMMPQGVLVCEDDDARAIEYKIRKNIREYELINDDKVMPDFFPIEHQVEINEFGVDVKVQELKESGGYKFIHPISDIDTDFEKLKMPEIIYHKEKTFEWKDVVEEAIGDILPVVFECRPLPPSLTQKAIRLIGMEKFYISMYENPDGLHRLMRYITDGQLKIMKFYEDNRLLTVNNGNQETCSSSYAFTDRLPQSGFDGHHVRLKDIWQWVESQETVGVAPLMFEEFCLPYYKEVAGQYGLVYYGCCEPVHPIWDSLHKAIPNIAKVSISPWCDQVYMGEMLAGTDIVFSRKPSPNFLGVDRVLDENAWAEHIRDTLKAARKCQCEFIIRDVYRVWELSRARRAIEIAHREIDRL